MDAFHSGKAEALVATDIAARGIHVDDVTLVVHADPPAEHKAYLHRSGRTARAGNAGTVVTLMTSEQVRDVRELTRAAGIKPTTTRINGSSHPVLIELAPGERTLSGSLETTTPSSSLRTRSGGGGGGRNRRGAGRGRSGSAQGSAGQKPSNEKSSGQKSSGQKSSGQRSGGNRARRTGSGGGTHSAASFSGRR